MAVALNTTTYKIQNATLLEDYHTKELQLGDGYIEVELDGLNYDREEYQVSFVPMSLSNCSTLAGILRNSVNGTSNVLSWTPYGEGTTKYWIAKNISRTFVKGNHWQVSCTLIKYFLVV